MSKQSQTFKQRVLATIAQRMARMAEGDHEHIAMGLLRDEIEALVELGPWTKTPPTDCGFYWLRFLDRPGELLVAEGPDEHGCWLLLGDESVASTTLLQGNDCEWRGPIEPPK
jgi:hypothetical protein